MMLPLLLPLSFLVCPGLAFSELESTLELERHHHHSHKFDIFILSLHWPFTTCLAWEERAGTCRRIPKHKWTVHGLWPTKLGHRYPHYCDNSWRFDHSQLESIWANLTEFWPDIEMRSRPYSLWEHEWRKHGTCAAQLESMDSELKYFSKGVELAAQNPVDKWLGLHGITPSNEGKQFHLEAIWEALLEGTEGMRPHVDCRELEGKAYIKEVKVCYSKEFQRVHCDGIAASDYEEKSKMRGTCMEYSSFLYPASAILPHALETPEALGDSHVKSTTVSPGRNITSTAKSTTTTKATPTVKKGGIIAGVVCATLALLAIGMGVGYIVWKKHSRSRGYESV